MYINKTEFQNFRNYKTLKLEFNEKVNILIGDNAQGKTNLIEGLYISSFGRSFRLGKDSEMIKFGESFCRVKVDAVKNDNNTSVEIVIGENEKGIKIDGVKIRKTDELLENILTVVFSPEDLRIIKGDPEKRRRFIDRELSQIRPSYYAELSSYRRVLMQRNALLKSGTAAQIDFDVWDSKLSEYGTKIISKRKEFIEKINRISRDIHKSITNEKEELEILYDSDVLSCDKPLLEMLVESRKKDVLRGYTEAGPHRDDLKVTVNSMDIRRFGSQGQQRTAALALKLAELKLIEEETSEKAVLLLDDVLSELDNERQNFLINSPGGAQLFITTTEINDKLKEKLPKGYVFYVENGTAERRF